MPVPLLVSGKPAMMSQPGTADRNKLRAWTDSGMGGIGAIQAKAQRMFRLEDGNARQAPHIVTINDVTRGLPLDDTDAQKIQGIITATRADYGMDDKTRYPRFAFALEALGAFLNATPRISQDVRMEVRKRANAWWRRFGKTTYEGRPMIRHVISKSQLASPDFDPALVLSKAGKGAEMPGHKYKSRKPKPGGGYEYTYAMEPYRLTVTGDDAEKHGKKLESAIHEAADVCKITPPVCHGNLGIERRAMPQLSDEAIGTYLAKLQARGVKVEKAQRPVGDLKATQGEIKAKKMNAMAGEYDAARQGKPGIKYPDKPAYDPSKAPIIVSKDGYVLDGHHRWAGVLTIDPSAKMNTYTVDLPIREMLRETIGFPGVSYAKFEDDSAMPGQPSKPKPDEVPLTHDELNAIYADPSKDGSKDKGTPYPTGKSEGGKPPSKAAGKPKPRRAVVDETAHYRSVA